ncbi:MAG: acyltransferase 3 [Stygiobacter sp.]|nr:MAG: acyltransferase 3 [Stygiobacter sp.]KAF0213753.1 MAG: acyltransferase [Ignavibacteria bacterium]
METKERQHDIDWLRVIAFYILIFFHVGMVFVPWEFHLKNSETVEWFETWMAFLHQWRLPLLFMISGIVLYHSMGKRIGKKYFGERSKRLLIPLIFGMFVIVPPQIYYDRLFHGFQFANYWEFWKTVFNFVPYPLGGSLSWHHLWYVLYIFVYSLIAYPLFKYLRNEKSFNLRNKIGLFVKTRPNSIYLLIMPMTVFYFTLAQKYPETHGLIDDWYLHSISFTLFIVGFSISAINGFWEVLVAKRKQSLILALIPALTLTLFVWGPTFTIVNEEADWFIYVYGLFKMVMIPSLLFAILGYGKVYLNKPGKLLTYANESVYPLYILHQSVELIFAYYIIQLDLGVLPKFVLLVAATFGISLLIYELLIKRFNLTRLLFGMKSKVKYQDSVGIEKAIAQTETN